MPLSKPFLRIYRPIRNRKYDYVKDDLYAENRYQLIRAYLNIERKLKEIFDYIEPAKGNLSVFSFELYGLFLRACAEVELNCKAIMESNGVNKKQFSMNDYVKLDKSSKLSKYRLEYKKLRFVDNNIVRYESKVLCPFEQFEIYLNATQKDGISPSPKWYSEYNEVKHNREQNFEMATLDNCMMAVAAILVLLYSQFGPYYTNVSGERGVYWDVLEDYYEPPFLANVIFALQAPTWDEQDCYDFDWSALRADPHPFELFPFN